ncbi:unnamed protein product [Cylindrotheca closterium]|uniref:Tudor domain-containing protein n=1 Tax=Cylindrotheca closterium TaxID=2856 RepID=A0AAD2FGV3_9STRA|nr:unnamed protein product [Cylindrotheca closterium]
MASTSKQEKKKKGEKSFKTNKKQTTTIAAASNYDNDDDDNDDDDCAPKLLLDHETRQLRKLKSLYQSCIFKADAMALQKSQGHSSSPEPVDVMQQQQQQLVEKTLCQPKHSSLKTWVELQQQMYDCGIMSDKQQDALWNAGVDLVARSESSKERTTSKETKAKAEIPTKATLAVADDTAADWQQHEQPIAVVVKQQDGTIEDKFLFSPETIREKVGSLKKELLEENPFCETTICCEKNLKRKRLNNKKNKNKKKEKKNRSQGSSSSSTTTNTSSSKRAKTNKEEAARISPTTTSTTTATTGESSATTTTTTFQAAPSEAAKRKRTHPKQPSTVMVGDTIWVHYEDDDWWYKGRVLASTQNYNAQSNHRQGLVTVQWEDDKYNDSQEALDVNNNGDAYCWGVDNDPNANFNQEKEELVSTLNIGCQLSIYWPAEQESFPGTLTKMDKSRKEKDIHYIEYEDGDCEWLNLNQRRFTILNYDDNNEEE